MTDNAMAVETALREAVKRQQNFRDYASAVDTITKGYLTDESKRQEFLEALAQSIREHNNG